MVDVSATATTRVRELYRGGRRKTDVIDASAAAAVVAARGEVQALGAPYNPAHTRQNTPSEQDLT